MQVKITPDHSRENPLIHLLPIQLWMKMLLWAVHMCGSCCFSFTNTLNSFLSGLLSSHSMPSLSLCLGLLRPRCGTLFLAFLRFAQGDSPACPGPSGCHPFPPAWGCTPQCGVILRLAEGWQHIVTNNSNQGEMPFVTVIYLDFTKSLTTTLSETIQTDLWLKIFKNRPIGSW